MPRSLPNCPARPENVRPWDGLEVGSYSIKVVTPMFGGGVEPGEPDPVILIRPSSIRGHLRFWWRATRGAACADAKELKQHEVKIFGDTENPSPLIVEVTIMSKESTSPCAVVPPNKSFPKFTDDHPGYVLFPFQGNPKKGIPIRSGTHGLTFNLRIIYPSKLRAEINAALWAWVNFGGIGSRSRRGCGALFCHDFSPNGKHSVAEINAWYMANFAEKCPISNSIDRPWPLLTHLLVIKESQQSAMKAWNEVISTFWAFRQGDGIGRNPGSGTPRRSRWPEPESIRRATRKRLRNHARMNDIPDDVYPRAEFGLPIIFHFKDGGDPPDTQLVPASGGFTRMASPLILKPLALSESSAVPVIVRLLTPGIDAVSLEQVNPPQQIEARPVRSRRASAYRNSPLGAPTPNTPPRSESGSALEAFIEFACERGFARIGSEVTP